MASLDKLVTQWTLTQPGHFDAESEPECWRMAWASSGIECSVQDFESILKARGVMANQIRNARNGLSPLFRLYIVGSNVGQDYSQTAHRVVGGLR